MKTTEGDGRRFCQSFLAIGFVIGATDLALPGWLNGLLFGALLSLADAIITKAWLPILTLGVVGGVVIGIVIGVWGQ